MEDKVRQAERQANRWHLKYNQLKSDLKETKDVILLYEGLLDKLTEQNVKLKDWIKTKKQQEKENEYNKVLKHGELPDISDCPPSEAFDRHHVQRKQPRVFQPSQTQLIGQENLMGGQ